MGVENLMDVEERIKLVTAEILKRFPDCYYTVSVLLWDDGTSSVECRHGDGDKIYNSRHRDGVLTYYEDDIRSSAMKVDAEGNEYYILMDDNWDGFFKEENDDYFENWPKEAIQGYITCQEIYKKKAINYYPPQKHEEQNKGDNN